MPTMDVWTSVVVLLIIGWLGGIVSQLFKLPRIVGMILLGIALYPNLHPALLLSPVVLSGNLAVSDAQNPASSIRTFALLIALMRGGLSVKSSFFTGGLAFSTILLATVPYACELVVMALLAPIFLPSYYGVSAPNGAPSYMASFESASVWAALSPSIVIPNMLSFVEEGLTEAGRVVLTGAPLEVSTALVTEGVIDGVLLATVKGNDPQTVLGHIPVSLFSVGRQLPAPQHHWPTHLPPPSFFSPPADLRAWQCLVWPSVCSGVLRIQETSTVAEV